MTAEQQRRDSTFTRQCCVFGLIISWAVGAASLLVGSLFLVLEETSAVKSPQLNLSHTWREVLPLILNVVVTLLNDSMGYIHNCALRWSLQREGKLEFNSNLRLLTASRYSRANGIMANTLHILGITLSYGSTSLIFLSLNPELARLLGKSHDSSDTTGMHINPVALLTLGFGILLQAVIATWALKKTDIPTWSSNPLDVARACVFEGPHGHKVEPKVGRCMMGADLVKSDAQARYPQSKQPAMLKTNFRIRYILFLLCVVPALSTIWGGVVLDFIKKGRRTGILGRSWALLPVFTGSTDSNCSSSHCTDGTSVLNVGWSASNGTAGTFGGVLVVAAFQAAVSLSLHCAELIVNLSRDEEIFRELISPKGTNNRYNSIAAALTSWQTLFLFALKAGVHWIFGLAINLQYQLGVNMYPPQVFYLAGFTLITFAFGMYLSLRRPRGYLPVSYGHIQTIADIIDEWPEASCMFWGEKFAGDSTTPGYTGTNTDCLNPPREDQLYGGPQQVFPNRWKSRHRRDTPMSSPSMVWSPATPSYPPQPFSPWGFPPQSQRYASSNSLYSSYSSQAPLLSGYGRS